MTRWELRFKALELALKHGHSFGNEPDLRTKVGLIENIVAGTETEDTDEAALTASVDEPDDTSGTPKKSQIKGK